METEVAKQELVAQEGWRRIEISAWSTLLSVIVAVLPAVVSVIGL
jgi:hypothetical protein